MERLDYISVETLQNRLKPNPFSSWSCSEEIEKQLNQLESSTMIEAYGDYRFRLSDEYPSYYITQILVYK